MSPHSDTSQDNGKSGVIMIVTNENLLEPWQWRQTNQQRKARTPMLSFVYHLQPKSGHNSTWQWALPKRKIISKDKRSYCVCNETQNESPIIHRLYNFFLYTKDTLIGAEGCHSCTWLADYFIANELLHFINPSWWWHPRVRAKIQWLISNYMRRHRCFNPKSGVLCLSSRDFWIQYLDFCTFCLIVPLFWKNNLASCRIHTHYHVPFYFS